MSPRYRVTLTKEERKELEAMTRRGKTHARRFIHARALLLCDAGADGPAWNVADVAAALGVTSRSIEHLKKRFVEDGLESALERKPREKPPREVIFDGAFEARLIALACSDAPEGRRRWTVRLLADKAVELNFAFIHARALLLCDAGADGPAWNVADVAAALGVTSRSIEHLKKRFVEDGLEFALERKPREKPPRELIFDGAFEARLIALACSDAPEGRRRWTVRLLADKAVELSFAETVSHMTVQRVLKKTNLSLTSASTGKSLPKGVRPS